VNVAGSAALWAAMVAALATLAGYLLAQSRARRERKAAMYAQALAAMQRFQELPYGIWRRPASTPEIRAALGTEISEAISQVAFHQALLRMDSEVVGTAYTDLWSQARRACRANRALAWRSPLIESDEAMADSPPFVGHDESDPERALCILAMRRELSVAGLLARRRTRRRLDRQRQLRERMNARPVPDSSP
jgi:hypothetical protein